LEAAVIYQQIDERAKEQIAPVAADFAVVENRIAIILADLEVEECNRLSLSPSTSRRREEEMAQLRKEQRNLQGKLENIRSETFRELLAEEYRLPRGKKFDTVGFRFTRQKLVKSA
jgi:hypothetical protein